MAKNKVAFVCTDCGAEHGQWQGQCAACKAWNTLSRFNIGSSSSPVTKADFRKPVAGAENSNVQALSEIDLQALPRFSSSIGELDRVLGGGLVPGSVILIGGNPGAGKSTRSNSPIELEKRGNACRSISDRVCTLEFSAPATGLRKSALVTGELLLPMLKRESVFHALQAAHWPCHCPCSAPQSVQTNATLFFAILRGDRPCFCSVLCKHIALLQKTWPVPIS